jgi:hypothetical protein
MHSRKAKRYSLSAPVAFWWERVPGIMQRSGGNSLDISSQGVFVVAELAPPPGVPLKVEVYLPSANGGPKSLQLHGEGRVVRVGRSGAESGFAVEVEFRTSTGKSVFGPEGLIH